MRVSMVIQFGEPLIYLLGLGYGLGQFIPSMDGLPYLTFLASGLVMSSVMNTATFEGMYSCYTRMDPQKTHQAMLATPLRVRDVVLGEQLWAATKGCIPCVALLLVATGLGAITALTALLVPLVALVAGLAFAGFCMPIVPFARSYDYFSYFYTLVIIPMFMFSGVFYPLENLPPFVSALAQLLPLSHAVELARPLVIGHWPDDVAVHLMVLVFYAVGGGYLSIKLFERRLMD
jgi:lipooligosaccharide transport system permease protein